MFKCYNADCLEVMANIPDKYVDGIITDPPYLIDYRTRWRDKTPDHRFRKSIKNDTNEDFVEKYIRECYRILKDNTAMFMFCSCVNIGWFVDRIKEAGFHWKSNIVWVKNNGSMGDIKGGLGRQYEHIVLVSKGIAKRKNDTRYTDVWFFDRISGNKQLHQNQKPVDLLERCVELYSSPGDLIFDGCMGVGSTGVACKNLGRNFLGVEIEKDFFEIAKKRLDNKLSLC